MCQKNSKCTCTTVTTCQSEKNSCVGETIGGAVVGGLLGSFAGPIGIAIGSMIGAGLAESSCSENK